MGRSINHQKMATVLSLSIACLATGCSSNPKHKNDPLEPVNRPIHYFNKTVDALYIKPISKAYELVAPEPIKHWVGNFINNVGEVPTIANDLLQGKFKQAVSDAGRFALNTTVGVVGLFDVAEPLGLKRHKEDLGQTLAVWGWEESAYLMLPILGPSTIRDGLGMFGDSYMSIPRYAEPKWRNRYQGMSLVHKRVELKDVETVVGAAGVDHYTLIRNGYLQSRKYQISDGEVSTQMGETDMLGEPPE